MLAGSSVTLVPTGTPTNTVENGWPVRTYTAAQNDQEPANVAFPASDFSVCYHRRNVALPNTQIMAFGTSGLSANSSKFPLQIQHSPPSRQMVLFRLHSTSPAPPCPLLLVHGTSSASRINASAGRRTTSAPSTSTACRWVRPRRCGWRRPLPRFGLPTATLASSQQEPEAHVASSSRTNSSARRTLPASLQQPDHELRHLRR